jgi:hypothetical protein
MDGDSDFTDKFKITMILPTGSNKPLADQVSDYFLAFSLMLIDH